MKFNALQLFIIAAASSTDGVSGYDVFKSDSCVWSHQQVYRETNRLADKGLTLAKSVPQDGKPDKIVYKVRLGCLANVQSYVDEWIQDPVLDNHILVSMDKLYMREVIDEAKYLSVLVAYRKHWLPIHLNVAKPTSVYELHCAEMAHAELKFVDALIKSIKA